jgi:predicted nucleic-acid-binding protein
VKGLNNLWENQHHSIKVFAECMKVIQNNEEFNIEKKNIIFINLNIYMAGALNEFCRENHISPIVNSLLQKIKEIIDGNQLQINNPSQDNA